MLELEGFLRAALEKRASVGSKLLFGGLLVGAGAVAGAKTQKALGSGQIMKGDAFRQQARQRMLERQGSLTG